jgi:hypothetical protein
MKNYACLRTVKLKVEFTKKSFANTSVDHLLSRSSRASRYDEQGYALDND